MDRHCFGSQLLHRMLPSRHRELFQFHSVLVMPYKQRYQVDDMSQQLGGQSRLQGQSAMA